jgi:hypothetical protein
MLHRIIIVSETTIMRIELTTGIFYMGCLPFFLSLDQERREIP